jgi:DNA polymerase III subunit beta
MKVNTIKFKAALDIASIFVSVNPIQVIKENLLFDATGPKLIIRAEDEDGGVMIDTGIEVDKDQRFNLAVPARILQSTFKQLIDAEVTLVADQEKAALEIISSNGRYKVACVAGADFPKFPKLPESKVNVKAESLRDALRLTLPVVSTDEFKYGMCGIRIAEGGKEGSSVFYSTDSHTLVRYENPTLKELPVNTTLHRKSTVKLLSVLEGRDEVTVSNSAEFKLFFEMDNITVYGTTIMDKFPDVGPFFGQPEEPISVRIKRSNILGSLKRANVYTQRSSPLVALSIKGQAINISGQDIDFNKGFSEELSIEHTGDDIEIAFNVSKLAELISLVEDEEIVFQISANNKPMRVRSENRRLEAMLMPAMLNRV